MAILSISACLHECSETFSRVRFGDISISHHDTDATQLAIAHGSKPRGVKAEGAPLNSCYVPLPGKNPCGNPCGNPCDELGQVLSPQTCRVLNALLIHGLTVPVQALVGRGA
jgi:hypothetical protein